MKITKIEAIPVYLPYKSDFHVASGVVKGVEKVIVRMHTNQGINGIGEALARPPIYGTTLGGIITTIGDILTPALIGADPINIRSLHQIMDRCIIGYGIAKAAFDEAAYDIAGKALGVPVSTLLGGALRDRIPVVPSSLNIGAPEAVAKEAKEGVARGFSNFKMKGTSDPWHDLRSLAAVREAIGNSPPIRLDPNEAYSEAGLETTILAAKEMEKYNLTLLESPIGRYDYYGLAQLRKAVSVPVMIHQGVQSVEDMVNLIRLEAADAFNITVMQVGGLYQAMRMVTMAESFSMSVLIGSACDTGIGTAASAHLASVVRRLPYACDCRFELRYVEDILKTPNRIEGGYTYVPQGPGLGIEVDDVKLRKYSL